MQKFYMQSGKEEEGKMEQKGSKKRAEMNEENWKKGGANSSKECHKTVNEEAENNDERGQPTKGIVGFNKSEKIGH